MKTVLVSMAIALLILAQSMTASAQTTVYLPLVATGGGDQQLTQLDSVAAGEAVLKSMNLSEGEYKQFHAQLQQMFSKGASGNQLDQNVRPAQADVVNGVISKNLNCPTGKGALVTFTTGPGFVTAQYYRSPTESLPLFANCNAMQCYYIHSIGGLARNQVLMHIVSTAFVAAYTLTGCVA